jgi:hypothetical protein
VKGFVGAIAMLAILLATAVLMTTQVQTEVMHKTEVRDLKIALSNTEVLIKQASFDCNWQKPDAEITTCVNDKAAQLIPKINASQNTTICGLGTFAVNGTKREADLTCYIKDNNTIFITAQTRVTVSAQ